MQIRQESGVPKPVASDKNSAEILSNLFISARTKKTGRFLASAGKLTHRRVLWSIKNLIFGCERLKPTTPPQWLKSKRNSLTVSFWAFLHYLFPETVLLFLSATDGTARNFQPPNAMANLIQTHGRVAPGRLRPLKDALPTELQRRGISLKNELSHGKALAYWSS